MARDLDRQQVEQAKYDGPCTEWRLTRCDLESWRRLLAELRDKDRIAQIREVQTFLNRVPYVIDPINWGVPDYWATPLQFFGKDGDCEDYAIAKFVSLKTLGFTDDDMRIVVLDDLNLGVAHAILVVYVDGRALVLDNQISQVIPADLIRHYRPIYSINQTAWWLHLP